LRFETHVIGQSLFDDVERKVVVETKAPRQKIDVSDQKSQLSLGEVYEQDYLKEKMKQKDAGPFEVTEEAQKEHAEIDSMMSSLFEKLDGLSNWHYKPKTIDATIEVVHDVPALTMEEVTPHAQNLAESRLAPQEVYSKKRKLVDMKGDTELTKEEKRAKRQASKKEFSERKKAKEAKIKARQLKEKASAERAE
jgi:U3 small nucleolar RNA-associated protein MPP10